MLVNQFFNWPVIVMQTPITNTPNECFNSVGTISVSSYFSFWKIDYVFLNDLFKESIIWHDFMLFLNSPNQIIFFYVMLESLNINSISIEEIKTKAFLVCVFYITWENQNNKFIVARSMLAVLYPNIIIESLWAFRY